MLLIFTTVRSIFLAEYKCLKSEHGKILENIYQYLVSSLGGSWCRLFAEEKRRFHHVVFGKNPGKWLAFHVRRRPNSGHLSIYLYNAAKAMILS